MSSIVGERCSSQASAVCCGVAPDVLRDARERVRLERREPTEREERRVRDPLGGAVVDEVVVGAVHQVVEVLHAHHRRDRPGLGELGGGDVADPEVADEALLLQLRQRREGLGERLVVVVGDAQVDDVEGLQAEPPEVLVHLADELVGRGVEVPRPVVPAPAADLGDDPQVVGVGVQGLADDLVDDERPVEVAGVDVGDTAVDGLAQDGDRLVAVARRAHDVGAGELHGAVAHAREDEVVGEREAVGECRCGHVPTLRQAARRWGVPGRPGTSRTPHGVAARRMIGA